MTTDTRVREEKDIQIQFVDDKTIVVIAIEPGLEYKDGKLVKNESKVEGDTSMDEDKRTMKITFQQKVTRNTVMQVISIKYFVW